MRNKSAYLGLLSSIVLLLVIVGVEIYINGRPENVAYCNNGGYPYSNRYYEYGDFAWSNVVWSKIFGSAMVYIELLFLLPFFGSLSDKSRSRFGKRIPFILLGTILSFTFMIFIPWKCRIADIFNLIGCLEIFCNLKCIFTVAFHTDC